VNTSYLQNIVLRHWGDSEEESIRAVLSMTNVYRFVFGREVEVATINSLKAETHDATLVFGTKIHQYGLEVLLV
jgi:hypothetical protein